MFDPPRTQSSQTHDWNFVIKDRILAQNNETSLVNWYSDVQLRPNYNPRNQESMESDDDSGVCTPPLWKNNSPSPPRSPSQPLLSHHHHNYRSLSPNSRQQAIARGQWELMEMVKNMPESSYELSLKDIVEQRPGMETQAQQEERLKNNDQRLRQRGGIKVKRQESKRYDKNMMRNGSFENKGLFLNMVFPFSFHSNKKKKSNFGSNTSGKVSPKPEVAKSGGGGERDWWKKKFTGSSDSDSSRTSNNSGSSGSTTSSGGSSSGGSHAGGRKKNGFLTGCWPFLQSRRGKE